jgi:outer membrane protein assembly factor BamD (BamD/ComL family)
MLNKPSKMKKLLPVVLIALLFSFTGCGPSRKKSAERIHTLEKQLFSPANTTFNRKKADSLIAMYEDYVKRFPDDSLSPKFLFQSSSILMNLGEANKAIEGFDKIAAKYPQYSKVSLCLFFKAFIYENYLHDLNKARANYEDFIVRYPNSEFVPSAQASIRNLGKTPEQMVREFEEKQKQDSIRKADSVTLARKTKKRK